MRLVSLMVVVLARLAFASNSPEDAQARAEDEFLVKVNLACDLNFKLRYDAASLKANNKDIGWDQTGGSNECNEPLRYFWYACQSAEGRLAVKRSEFTDVRCEGVKDKTGSLERRGTTLVVKRAYEEPQPFVRALKQFQDLLKVKLALDNPDPYYDRKWDDLRLTPNPVTSTTDYCVIDGKKVELSDSPIDQAVHQKLDRTMKCVEHGVVVTDLVFKAGLKTGIEVQRRDDWKRKQTYKDGKRQGLEETTDHGVRLELTNYENDARIWEKTFLPDGGLAKYSHQFPKSLGSIDFDAQGRVQSLICWPEAANDDVLKSWCGFGQDRVVQIFDGTGKLNRTVTFSKGRLAKQVPGDSAYAPRSTQTFVEGEQEGEERVVRKDQTLEAVLHWKHGVQDGLASHYSDDGKKLVREETWANGELRSSTEFFLNGQAKRRETYSSKDALQRIDYFDVGGTSATGSFVRCKTQWSSRWCPTGTHQKFFEDGGLSAEQQFVDGELSGLSKSWSEDGSRSEEKYEKRALLSRKQWAPDGGLVLDEEYEADGSRKRR